jgi:poly(A) polymerase/tRNA nucleotidyltransferase (CCA-adding enzyme)
MLPPFILNILQQIEDKGFEAYAVGGCVRDLLMGVGKEQQDWDITTNALPRDVLKIFPQGKYNNEFGTVLVPYETEQGNRSAVEITTFRSEGGYSDRRHPDNVKFEKDLDKDLGRRDFTINALAMKPEDSKLSLPADLLKWSFTQDGYVIVDLFGGVKDIKKRVIRAVGEPEDRFKEDALRMMRAIRFACRLDFSIEDKTERAIKKMAGSIKFIANERIRDELIKILESDNAYNGIMFLHENKMLQYILPEVEQGVGVKQDRHHIYTVFKHSVLALKNCPGKDWRVRLAALLHDVGKPKVKRIINGRATFYNHEYVSAKMASKIADRLKFSKKDKEKVVTLVRNHMFYYDVGEVTASSVRRLIKNVGEENLGELINVRIADRLGSGVPKAKPYKLRHLEYMMKKVRKDPISVKMLKINGDILMKELGMRPGPKIGAVLEVLLSEVLDDPGLNNKKYLLARSKELKDEELSKLRERAKEKIEQERKEQDREMKKEFKVK